MPIVNFLFTLALLVVSLLFYFGKINEFFINSIMATKWSFIKALGSIFIQPDLFSIIIGIIFIIALGNALNSVIGNYYYLIFIIFFSLLSSVVHSLTSTIPPIGIYGPLASIAGAVTAMLPSNKLVLYKSGDEETGINFSMLIILWIIFTVYSSLTFLSIINKWALIACFFGGGIAAYTMIKLKLVSILDTTFFEWLNDGISLLTTSEYFASLLPTRKTLNADDEIKKKAEKLLEQIDFNIDKFEEIGPPPEMQQLEKKPTIKIRLLKPVKQKDHIILYFVFEGEEISNVSASSENYKCEIFPSEKLKHGDSGSIKIFVKNQEGVDSYYFTLKYTLNNIPCAKDIVYSVSSNEIRNL